MILLFALWGCPSSTPPEPSAPPIPAAPEPGTPPDSACVKGCMDGRMMQAVGIEKIREDCRVECGEAPKPPF